MRSSAVCVLLALGGVGVFVLDGCGGRADGGVDGGQSDSAQERVVRSCEPLPGCTSTTTCPSDCNSCTCLEGAWACTALACTAGRCCPADPQPGCCMHYGGWSDTGLCGATCDGMPLPDDPAWYRVTDSHGCSIWSSQGSTGRLCGQADAGVETPVDAARDTGRCVSARGAPCGGNTADPCSCAAGLVCRPGSSGLPFGDVGGTCADEGDAAAAHEDAGRDAGAFDAGGDGGVCEWGFDGGGQRRWCPAGTRCCGGGAAGTAYCYAGVGPCPAVP